MQVNSEFDFTKSRNENLKKENMEEYKKIFLYFILLLSILSIFPAYHLFNSFFTISNKNTINLVRMTDEEHIKNFLTYDSLKPNHIVFSSKKEEEIFNSILSYDQKQSPIKTISPGNYHIFTEVLNLKKEHRANNYDFYTVSVLKHFSDKNNQMEIDIPVNFYIDYKNGVITNVISTNPQSFSQ